jgi:hypothetical protein
MLHNLKLLFISEWLISMFINAIRESINYWMENQDEVEYLQCILFMQTKWCKACGRGNHKWWLSYQKRYMPQECQPQKQGTLRFMCDTDIY